MNSWWTRWVPNGSSPWPPGRTRRSCFEISPTSASQWQGMRSKHWAQFLEKPHKNDLKSIKKSRLQGVLQDILDQICWNMDYKSCMVLKLPATGHGTRYTREMLIKQLSLEFSGESGSPGIPKHKKSQKIVPWDPRTRDIDNLTTSFHICSIFVPHFMIFALEKLSKRMIGSSMFSDWRQITPPFRRFDFMYLPIDFKNKCNVGCPLPQRHRRNIRVRFDKIWQVPCSWGCCRDHPMLQVKSLDDNRYNSIISIKLVSTLYLRTLNYSHTLVLMKQRAQRLGRWFSNVGDNIPPRALPW